MNNSKVRQNFSQWNSGTGGQSLENTRNSHSRSYGRMRIETGDWADTQQKLIPEITRKKQRNSMAWEP